MFRAIANGIALLMVLTGLAFVLFTVHSPPTSVEKLPEMKRFSKGERRVIAEQLLDALIRSNHLAKQAKAFDDEAIWSHFSVGKFELNFVSRMRNWVEDGHLLNAHINGIVVPKERSRLFEDAQAMSFVNSDRLAGLLAAIESNDRNAIQNQLRGIRLEDKMANFGSQPYRDRVNDVISRLQKEIKQAT